MAGYIASEFERFTAICLAGRTPEQISDARMLFYAGALATVDAINRAMSTADQAVAFANTDSILKECDDFQAELTAKAKSKPKGKK